MVHTYQLFDMYCKVCSWLVATFLGVFSEREKNVEYNSIVTVTKNVDYSLQQSLTIHLQMLKVTNGLKLLHKSVVPHRGTLVC